MRTPEKGQGKWRQFLNECVAHPNEWNRFLELMKTKQSGKQYAIQIKKGIQHGKMLPEWPDGEPIKQGEEGEWDAYYCEYPTDGCGTYAVYARWNVFNLATIGLHPTPPEEVKRVINESAGPVRQKSGRSARR